MTEHVAGYHACCAAGLNLEVGTGPVVHSAVGPGLGGAGGKQEKVSKPAVELG